MPRLPDTPQFLSSPPAPMTPLQNSSGADKDLILMAPVKKYPCRTRHLTDHGVRYWKPQMNKTEVGDVFLSSLVTPDGKQLASHKGGCPRVPAEREPTSNYMREVVPGPPMPEQEVGPASTLVQHHVFPARPGSNEIVKYSHSKLSEEEPESLLQREVKLLRLRVGRLERAERRLQQQVHLKGELVKDTKVIAEEAQAALIAAEETISDLEASLRTCRGQADRYQGWWLTEYHSLKVVLARLPPHEREDFKHIIASSKARFTTYCTEL